jgi:V/A-type H+-transporting ATPase subunit E
MEVKLDNLIEKIKADGIEEANQKADEIIENAKKEAADLKKKAQQEADQIISDAEKEAKAFEDKSKRSLQLAARDTELLVKEKLTALFDRSLKSQVSDTLKPDFLKTLILKVVDQWKDSETVQIELNEDDQKQLEPLIQDTLKTEIKDSLTLKVSDRVTRGFQIRIEDGDVYYDLTDDNIAQVLYLFLNPKLKEMLDGDNG